MNRTTAFAGFLMIIGLLFCCEARVKKKVYFINSYHEGYGSSDDVMLGMKRILADKVDLRMAFMDTKRNSDPGFINEKVNEILAEIQAYAPDIIIAADDNAVKYIVEPHFGQGPTPVVFCGVNWSADPYKLSRSYVTGILEVMPFIETVEAVKASFPDVHSLTVLSENTETEEKNKLVMQPLFDALELEVIFRLVDDFDAWKQAFVQANAETDLIYIPTNGAIENWDEVEARQFVAAHIKKPVITCDDFMMPYAVFGLTKIAVEQGEWAAVTALGILEGKKPEDIAIAKNTQSQAWLNSGLAEKIRFQLPEQYQSTCRIVNE